MNRTLYRVLNSAFVLRYMWLAVPQRLRRQVSAMWRAEHGYDW